MSTARLKKELLKLLEEDEEFRYAVAAKLGLLEILKRLDRYEERFLAIEEELKRLREDFNKLYQKGLEHDKRFEEMNRRLSRIELELGVLSESFYCRAILEDLEKVLASRGEKILRRERNVVVDDREVDLLIESDRALYVVEIKVKANHEDVDELLSKAEAVSRRYPGKRVVAVLAGALIGREVVSYARGRGVEVYLV